jgi:hypothetical protein
VTAAYSIAFASDKPDLTGGRPAAQVVYAELKEQGDIEYERVRDAIKRLIAAPPYSESNDDPDLVGGPGSRWARRHLYRFGSESSLPPDVTAFTIWINTPQRRWWLTWSRDPREAKRLLIYSLTPAPET